MRAAASTACWQSARLVDKTPEFCLAAAPHPALRHVVDIIHLHLPRAGDQSDEVFISPFSSTLKNAPEIGIKRPVQSQFSRQRGSSHTIRMNAQFFQRPGKCGQEYRKHR